MTYATVDDMTTLWRPMTEAEQARAGPLLEVISASLDVEARKVGKDLPALVASDSALALVAKSVAVDVAARALMTSTDQEPMTQLTQAAGRHSQMGGLRCGVFREEMESHERRAAIHHPAHASGLG